MNEQLLDKPLVSENSFEQIFQRRIHQIEEKVSKYCSQYDGLMNLLPIGNQLSSLLSFQKDIQNMESKIENFNEKINTVNEYQVSINKSLWEKQLSSLKQSNTQVKEQIQKIKQVQKEKANTLQYVQFEQKLEQQVKQYEQILTTKLATFKNRVQNQRHKEYKQNFKQVYKSINEKIQQYLRPYHEQLDQLLEEIKISRLKISFRDVKDFHDFNHQRLLQEIILLNLQLEKHFQSLNHPKQGQIMIDSKQIDKIAFQIESIKYQAIGNRQKCLNDILFYPNYQKASENSYSKMEIYINESYEQLQESLIEIQQRLDLLVRFIAQN